MKKQAETTGPGSISSSITASFAGASPATASSSPQQCGSGTPRSRSGSTNSTSHLLSSPANETPRRSPTRIPSIDGLKAKAAAVTASPVSPGISLHSPGRLVSPTSATKRIRSLNKRMAMVGSPPVTPSMSSPSPRQRQRQVIQSPSIFTPSLAHDTPVSRPPFADGSNDNDDADDYIKENTAEEINHQHKHHEDDDEMHRQKKKDLLILDDDTAGKSAFVKRREYEKARTATKRRKRFVRITTICCAILIIYTLVINSWLPSKQLTDRFNINQNKNRQPDEVIATAVTDDGAKRVTRTKDENEEARTSSPSTRSSTPSVTAKREPPSSMTIDVLSIGSQTRLDYLEVQKASFFNVQQQQQPIVRRFFNATEVDDYDPACHSSLNKLIVEKKNNSLEELTAFCKHGGGDRKGLRRDLVRRDFVKYFMPTKNSKWFESKHDKVGWICAQQRPLAGLEKVVKSYRLDVGESGGDLGDEIPSFPDYLVLVDDDTYINIKTLKETLIQHEHDNNIDSSQVIALAGCQIKLPSFSFANGGLGLILSEGLLRRLLEPMDLADSWNDRPIQNHMNERSLYRPGMNLIELFASVARKNAVAKYPQWTFPGYCFHSDWIWGYIFKYYGLVTLQTLTVKSSAVNGDSKSKVDICEMVAPNCDKSLVCHNADPELMRILAKSQLR